MKNRRWIAAATSLLLLLGTVTQAAAQSRTWEEHYRRGVELFERAKYGMAQVELEKALAGMELDERGARTRGRYFLAMSAALEGKAEAQELLERFVRDYPMSIYLNDIYYALGLSYAQRGDYAEAMAQFERVNPAELEFSRQDEYNYRRGHAAYELGNYDEAYTCFQRCVSDSKFLPHATYYRAYIDYTRGDLAAAKTGFVAVQELPVYAPIVPFYLLQIAFLQSDYDYVIEHAEGLSSGATQSRQREIARILSEAYFHEGAYSEALSQIRTYEELGGEMGREERYIAGLSNYRQMYFTRSLSDLEAVSVGEDALAQNASFHLGGAYLQLAQKRKALGAFALASKLDFNQDMQEEALFNYGKLQFDLGGGAFNEAITVLADYTERYPNSPRIDEARELLLSAYLNTRNYEAAYEAIQRVKNPDNNIKSAMQKVAYFQGVGCFDRGEYDRAIAFFDIADKHRFNAKYTALTRFWRAESMARKGEYKTAVPIFQEYLRVAPSSEQEYKMAYYNLGYCYFNTQQWSAAQQAFVRFITLYKTPDNYRADALNRLGDVSFAQRDYAKADERYSQALRLGGSTSDYTAYQKAVVMGLDGKRDQKITALRKITTTAQGDYVDDAMYELGRTYVQQEQFSEGASTLKELVAAYPSSPYYLPALSDLGLIYQNLDQDASALQYYKMVVEQFPGTRQSQDAMLGIKNIYVDRNEVDNYFDYVKESGAEVSVSQMQRDSLTYEAAERVYQNGNYSRALSLMDNYLMEYPKGAYRASALYALGDCSLREGNPEAALTAFEEVAMMPSNPYKINALQQAARLQREAGNPAASADLYRTLSQVANRNVVVVEALGGYLTQSVATGDHARMAEAADEVLASKSVTEELICSARFAKAKVLLAQHNNADAMLLFKQVAKQDNRDGAESRYHIISILFNEGKIDEAEKEVFAMAEANLSDQYWTAKSFLILGDIYLQRDDTFQARATYQSIVDGYAEQGDGIAEEARQRVDALKTK